MLSSVALLLVVATIGAVLLRRAATGEALNDASAVTVAFGHSVLRDQVTPAVLRGDHKAVRALDRAVHERVLGRPIVRIKVWTPHGRIVYSDARPLIGRSFPVRADMREALVDDSVRADVSDLSLPENRLERGRGRLVEVYMPLRTASGQRVMVEAYHPAGSIDATSSRIWRTFLPVLFALLVALAAAQLPLAWSHTRRSRAEAREREQLAREAESSLHAERGRIATELHEGVVQDLAGVAYALQAAAIAPAGDAPDGDLRGLLHRGADVCRRSMTTLRELLVDLRSVEPAADDLPDSLEALAGSLRARGVEVSVDVRLDAPLPGDAAELVHRAAREALRNVHSDARQVGIVLGAENGEMRLVVEDDGRSAGGDAAEDEGDRHVGLLRLADSLAARGGSLSISSERGVGTRVTASLPRR
jgi:two-component system NarL family sensor kinase